MIQAPGIYDLPAEVYHGDPCDGPSLSRSVALALIRRSPKHARHIHPRLTKQDDPTPPTQVMDEGTALHDLILGKGATIATIQTVYGPKHKAAGEPVRDYKTDAAQDERDELRAFGKTPILAHRLPELLRCKTAVMAELASHQDGDAFTAPGRSEAVVVAKIYGAWLRCMVDRLPDDPREPPFDLKLTGLSAAPGGWERRLINEYAFQCAFYRRVLAAVEGRQRPAMRFVVAEVDAPYGVAVMAAAESLQAVAEAEVDRAIRLWAQCVKTDAWPGYPPFTAHVEAPTWMQTKAEEAALRDQFVEENVL